MHADGKREEGHRKVGVAGRLEPDKEARDDFRIKGAAQNHPILRGVKHRNVATAEMERSSSPRNAWRQRPALPCAELRWGLRVIHLVRFVLRAQMLAPCRDQFFLKKSGGR